ncbi:hypothetical protein [Paenibacillus xerothermodurans]|uniref:hypothetical protein n=1 Tax=Paenibacillus xerothermodurans TaxID=1977292 RepID=UPI001403C050|nr:hypothetical protein [Paenibacillus xerothermodurans]
MNRMAGVFFMSMVTALYHIDRMSTARRSHVDSTSTYSVHAKTESAEAAAAN